MVQAYANTAQLTYTVPATERIVVQRAGIAGDFPSAPRAVIESWADMTDADSLGAWPLKFVKQDHVDHWTGLPWYVAHEELVLHAGPNAIIYFTFLLQDYTTQSQSFCVSISGHREAVP